MQENYLSGERYVQLNALLSAMAWNLKKWMQKAISWLYEKYISYLFIFQQQLQFMK
jgi:hypothetical protein